MKNRAEFLSIHLKNRKALSERENEKKKKT
jgi:hypothetical protein